MENVETITPEDIGAETISVEEVEPRQKNDIKAEMLDMLVAKDNYLAGWQRRMDALNRELSALDSS